jgi:hypothetical protein
MEHTAVNKSRQLALVNSKQFADVLFLVGPGKTPIYAHKVLLLNGCDYFATMFTSGMEEAVPINGLQQVLFPETTPEAFECLQAHIYAGSTTGINADNLVDVALLADRCLDPQLLDECLNLVPALLSVTTCLKMLFGLRPLLTLRGRQPVLK